MPPIPTALLLPLKSDRDIDDEQLESLFLEATIFVANKSMANRLVTHAARSRKKGNRYDKQRTDDGLY